MVKKLESFIKRFYLIILLVYGLFLFVKVDDACASCFLKFLFQIFFQLQRIRINEKFPGENPGIFRVAFRVA